MTKDQLLTFIESSFLSDARKQHARETVLSHGESSEYVYDTLHSLFQEELFARGDQFYTASKMLDDVYKTYEKKYVEEHEELARSVEQSLSSIDIASPYEKEQLWNAYYAKEERLLEQFRSDVKSSLSAKVISLLRTTL